MEKAKLSEGTIVHQDYLDIWEEEDKKMSDADIPKHIIKLSNAGFPPSAQGHKTLPEKIIWFADATISNDRIVPIEQRNIDLERGWNGQEEDETKKSLNNRKSDLYMEVEGYQGMKLFHVQRKLAREVGSEFIKIMEDAGKDMTYVTPDNLAYYFLDRFIQKVNNYTVID
jgi:hypothetical protein